MRKIKLLMLLLCLLPSLSKAAMQTDGRHNIDAGWQFLQGDMGNVWEVFRPVKPGKPESVPLWQDVDLPHCFNALDAVDPSCNYYQGAGWYRKNLTIDNPYKDGRVLLEFEGAGQATQVYVYTQLVATHVGGYDRWTVDITDVVKKRGEKVVPVAVRCDNTRNTERIPSSMSDFNLYGGLYRHVNIIYQPAVAIEDIQLKADVRQKTIEVKPILTPAQGNEVLSLTLLDPSGKAIFQKSDQVANFSTIYIKVKKPQLWDVDSPKLYTLKATLTVNGQQQTYEAQTGFRSFEFREHGPFFLNGRRLLLQGTHRHEDHAGVAAAMTDEMVRHEMQQIKDMGANFIRLGHYQQSDLVLQLCDSLGILVWEEIPWCRGGLGGKEYQAQAERMLSHMITYHYNHPSIILWGLGNENDWSGDFPEFSEEAIHSFMSHLNDVAHELDNSRKTTIRRCDFCSDITDVYSPTVWAGWYSRKMTDYREMEEAAMAKFPHFFHAEWGGDSHVGRHTEGDQRDKQGDTRGDWSETYIVYLFDWTLKEQLTMPNLTGAAFWTFKDFSTPLRPTNPIPYVNQKGVVERDGTPKEAYYVFQSYWSKKPMVHVYGHSWPVRGGELDEEKQMLVYSNCKEVELFVNGVSQGRRKRNPQDFPAAGFHWNVKLQPGDNEIKAVGDKQQVDVIHQEYQVGKWGKPHHFVLSKHQQADGNTLVEAQLVDSEGKKCLDAMDVVTFGLTGDAMLLENQGTSTGSRVIQASNGRARIQIVRQTGKAVVSVKVKGVPTAFLEL